MAAQMTMVQSWCFESFTVLSLVLPPLRHLVVHLRLYHWRSTFSFWGQVDLARYQDRPETQSLCISSLAVQLPIPADSLEISCFFQHLVRDALVRDIGNI